MSLPWPLAPVAHRGLHDAQRGRVENTASAVAAALARGYAIEVDLQAARDDVPVVFHDETVDRLLDGTGAVADRSVAELQGLAPRVGTDRVMTFDDLLAMVDGRVPLYVEVKTLFGPPGRFAAAIADRVRRYAGPLALMSFDHALMRTFRDLVPATPRGLISYRWDDGWMPHLPAAERDRLRRLDYAAEVAPAFIAWDIDDLPDPAPLTVRAERGIPLLTWTVRTSDQRRRAAEIADAIIFEGFEP